MQKTLDAAHNNRKVVNDAVSELDRIAHALAVLGMDYPSARINTVMDLLEKSAKEITDAISVDLNEQIKNSEEQNRELVRSLLKGL